MGADAAAKPAMQPRKPSPNILPEPMFIGPSLIKPAGTLKQTAKKSLGRCDFQLERKCYPSRANPCFSDKHQIRGCRHR